VLSVFIIWGVFIIWIATLNFFAVGFARALWRILYRERDKPHSLFGLLVGIIFTASLWYFAVRDDIFLVRLVLQKTANP
jgi:hypothetical protein